MRGGQSKRPIFAPCMLLSSGGGVQSHAEGLPRGKRRPGVFM